MTGVTEAVPAAASVHSKQREQRMLEPDRDQLEKFVRAMFPYARSGFASLRVFPDGDKKFPPKIHGVDMRGGLGFLTETAEDHARRAAQMPERAVFAPPIATFREKDRAREIDIVLGLALSVECDKHPANARETLERLLGPATAVVASGGTFINGSGPEPKLHLHWRLAESAHDEQTFRALKWARELATRLAGGDPSNTPIVHPIRWPGSWHRKTTPIMCRIVAIDNDREISLDHALQCLIAAGGTQTVTAARGGIAFDDLYKPDEAALTATVLAGDDLHDSLNRLAMMKLMTGLAPEAVVADLRTTMEMSQAARDARWKERYDDIPRAVKTAMEKLGAQAKAAQPGVDMICIREVEMEAVEWLWPDRFALGKLGLIVGLPDEGKGQILADMAARITAGAAWPCDEGVARKGSVILLTAEDDLGDTVKPRLAAAGADMSKVHVIRMVKVQNRERMFSLISDLELLRSAIAKVGDIVQVQIDPMSAYLGVGKVDSYRTTDVRAVLAPLVDLAGELHVSIVGIMHFNKKVDVTNALLRISDSLAFGATARHVFAAVDDDQNQRKLLVRGKNNLARKDVPALSYGFGVKTVGFDKKLNKEITAPHIVWMGHVDVTASEAMQAATSNKSPSTRDAAKKLLLDLLANGPVPANAIWAAADANCIAERTLKRAKEELKVQSDKTADGWVWSLPAKDSIEAIYSAGA